MRAVALITLALATTAILGVLPTRPETAELSASYTLIERYTGSALQDPAPLLSAIQASQSDTVERALARAVSELPAPRYTAPQSAPRLHEQRPVKNTQTVNSNYSVSTADRLRAVRSVLDSVTRGKRDTARLSRQIVTECEKAQFDPLFVAAVIKSESFFNELARSNKGAVGLMQIMPATGKYLEKFRSEADWPTPAKLTDAGYNIHLGVTYLKQLEEMYGGNRVLTLIAYNWGPGKLDRAIRSGRGIPAETVRYALKILSDRHGWTQQRATA